MRVLLLAGGGGTRLWPLSTEERPKQFLPLLTEKSLLAETYERVKPLGREIFAATVEPLAPLVRRELKGLPADRLLVEPARRNSTSTALPGRCACGMPIRPCSSSAADASVRASTPY